MDCKRYFHSLRIQWQPRHALNGRSTSRKLSVEPLEDRSVLSVTTYLDFQSLENALNEPSFGLADAAGVDIFSTDELMQIRDGIQKRLEGIYQGFSVTFTQQIPAGDHERIKFEAAGSPTSDLGFFPYAYVDNLNKFGFEGFPTQVLVRAFEYILREY
jgi:hypothetical protein